MVGQTKTTIEVICPPRHKWQKPCEGSSYTDRWELFLELSEFRGEKNPNRPDVINDSRTWKSEDGQTEYRFRLDLKRCK
jgi:hypothetical protein